MGGCTIRDDGASVKRRADDGNAGIEDERIRTSSHVDRWVCARIRTKK
jgi:hypothetical protein